MTNISPITTTEIQHGLPDSKTSSTEALLIALQGWVLRLMADPKSKPGQVLNALRRLEMMREFPLRQEKQARTLALAEARVELRRRALDLREAQLKERKEKRDCAAEKAAAKAVRIVEKAKSSTPKSEKASAAASTPTAPPVPGQKIPLVSPQSTTQQTALITQSDWARMPLIKKAFGPMLDDSLRKAV